VIPLQPSNTHRQAEAEGPPPSRFNEHLGRAGPQDRAPVAQPPHHYHQVGPEDPPSAQEGQQGESRVGWVFVFATVFGTAKGHVYGRKGEAWL
jgi:hypothetical protein